MPVRFFKLDKTRWTINVLASLKFGFAVSVFREAVSYGIRYLLGQQLSAQVVRGGVVAGSEG
jgi:hypothetical protein